MKIFTFIFLLLATAILFPIISTAQTGTRQCGTTENTRYLLENTSGMKEKMSVIESKVSAFINTSALQTRTSSKFTIPVVVHVVYNNAMTNVSDDQVQSQIDALNLDYNKKAVEINQTPSVFAALVADCSIQFKLAVRDENGKKTNGIIHHATSRYEWGARDDVKTPAKGGFAPWNADRYLNLYVCSIGNGILGYATTPGTPKELDGVVIDFSAFGTIGTARKPFNLGRTATHEIGHWLGLIHIWGDSECGNDLVSDTPVQKEAYYGNIIGMVYSNCTGKNEPNMSMDFMDYVNDACMWMFSEGQKIRMWAMLSDNNARGMITKSDALAIPNVPVTCAQIKNTRVLDVTQSTVSIGWDTLKNINEYSLELKSKTDSMWTVSPTQQNSFTINRLNSSATYQFRVKGNCLVAPYSTVSEFTTKSDSVLNNQISVYPNPISSDFTVKMPQHNGENMSVEVFDTNGHGVYKNEFINSSDPNVDLSNANKGLYFVVIKTGNDTVTRKIVKAEN